MGTYRRLKAWRIYWGIQWRIYWGIHLRFDVTHVSSLLCCFELAGLPGWWSWCTFSKKCSRMLSIAFWHSHRLELVENFWNIVDLLIEVLMDETSFANVINFVVGHHWALQLVYLLMFLSASVFRSFTPQNKHLVWPFNKENDPCIEAHSFCFFMFVLASVFR